MDIELSQRDPLTGIPSRAMLAGRLVALMDGASSPYLPFALCILDLDHFKSINDAFGHRRGDAILAEFAVRCLPGLREGDSFFRYGGDEFVLLLVDASRRDTKARVDRLATSVTARPFPGEPPLSVTLSIGVALFPEDGGSAEALFEVADHRLYEAKRQGRARAVLGDETRSVPGVAPLAGRLIERDTALETLERFLSSLPHRGRGVLAISGPTGSGHTRMLTDAVDAARLRNYATLTIAARPALRTRPFGALRAAKGLLFDIELAQQGAAPLMAALRTELAGTGRAGLLFAVDGLLDLDRATLELLVAVLDLVDRDRPIAALICTLGPYDPSRVRGFDPSIITTLNLAPLSLQGTRLWLREALRCELPEAFVRWLYQEVAGLPAMLERATGFLIADRRIIPDSSGWLPHPERAMLPLPINTRAARPATTALPAFGTAFLGRIDELQAIKGILDAGALVTVVGPGGAGKTRLAVQAAAELDGQFADGVVFVALAALSSGLDLADAIVSALGLLPAGRESPETVLLESLEARELLLVLDNIEHLRDGLGLLGLLRARAPRLTILATSREVLHLEGEQAVALGGLLFEADRHGLVAETSAPMQLFIRRATSVRSGFSLDQAERLAVARIITLVEGLPLGIELAAAWAATLGPVAVARSIEENLDFLSGQLEGDETPRSTRAVLDYFWGTLSAPEHDVVCSLAVFRGGFTREAARQVAEASTFFVDALVHKAFLTNQGTGRFHLHELLRHYAERQRAAIALEDLAARTRHAGWAADLAEAAVPLLYGPEQRHWFDRLELEHPNLRAALSWSFGDGVAPELGLRLSTALAPFWAVRGHIGEGRSWLARGIEGPGSYGYPSVLRRRALCAASDLAIRQADFEVAGAHLREALALCDALADRIGLAEVLTLQGRMAMQQGALAQATEHLEAALALDLPIEAFHGRTMTLFHLGKVANLRGEYARARSLYEEGLALVRQSGDVSGEAFALNGLATLACDLGSYERAVPLLEESLALRRMLGDTHGSAAALLNLGTARRNQGDLTGAGDLLRQALALLRQVGSSRGVIMALTQLGKLAYVQDDHPQATEHYLAALTLLRSKPDPEITTFVFSRLAAVAAAQERHADAAALYGAEARLRETAGLPLPPADREEYESQMASARAALDPATWEAAWATGHGWALDQAISAAIGAAAVAIRRPPDGAQGELDAVRKRPDPGVARISLR